MTVREIGAITITTVVEQEGPIFGTNYLIPDWNEDALAEHRDWLVPRHYDPVADMLVAPIQSFLVRTPHHTILVDGCFGNHKERANPKFNMLDTPWIERLAEAGATPDDIDFVMCTHLHGDHVGWNTRLENGEWVPTFANATYLFAEKEWRHWDNLARETGAFSPAIVDSVLPVIDRGQVQFVGMDHEIEDEIAFQPLTGHTPGHVGLNLKGGGREVIITGDMMHHPIQCVYPDWCSAVCVTPSESAKTRRAFLERYADTDTIVAPAHFPTPTFGFIDRAGESFRWRYDE